MKAAIERAMHNVTHANSNEGCLEITSEGKWHTSVREFRRKRFVSALLCWSQTLLWFIFVYLTLCIIDIIKDFYTFLFVIIKRVLAVLLYFQRFYASLCVSRTMAEEIPTRTHNLFIIMSYHINHIISVGLKRHNRLKAGTSKPKLK